MYELLYVCSARSLSSSGIMLYSYFCNRTSVRDYPKDYLPSPTTLYLRVRTRGPAQSSGNLGLHAQYVASPTAGSNNVDSAIIVAFLSMSSADTSEVSPTRSL
mmetsp:Transcript_9591/g.26083  ORF Transcript_9591/g.26083 Transcript_9591/m.26083 type:complete len:103 (+) Transcript_9591:19-327(+)